MNYNYKCQKCDKIQEIEIKTIDIHIGTTSSIDQTKLDERINEKRFCECGGKLKKVNSFVGEPLFVQHSKPRHLNVRRKN
jgi:hypothetical protein